jgi:hypothetical protein
MITQRDILVEAERRKHEIARAETERQIQHAMGHNRPSISGYQHWLTRLGAQLEIWGHGLQARYDETLSVSSASQQEP